MALITVTNLTVGYENQPVVRDLNFQVERGDYLCIVGENGSGKTTLMKTLLHLQPPLAGEIRMGDGMANEIGYLPQQTVVQRDFPASVSEIVLSGLQARMGLRPFYTAKEREIARRNMERMEIAELAEHPYRALSGGQQQRVLLARALCAAREVLLLDEPVSGLDPRVTAQMYQLIQSLNEEGITIIMISHDIAAASRYASHILHIGEHLFFGTREEYLRSEIGKYFLSSSSGAAESDTEETEESPGVVSSRL